jgi:hypothetical protein
LTNDRDELSVLRARVAELEAKLAERETDAEHRARIFEDAILRSATGMLVLQLERQLGVNLTGVRTYGTLQAGIAAAFNARAANAGPPAGVRR